MMVMFLIGSALCGAAPNSLAFILGRTISGIAAGGILSGTMVMMIESLPMHKRSVFQAGIVAIMGVSSIAGPLIGGALTSSSAGWRWTFVSVATYLGECGR